MPNKSCNATVTWTGGVTSGDTGEFWFRDAKGCRHGIVFSIGGEVDKLPNDDIPPVPVYAAELKCRPCQGGTHFTVDDNFLIKTTNGGYYLGFDTRNGRLGFVDTTVDQPLYLGIDVERFNSRTGTYFTVRSSCGCKLISNTVIIEDLDSDEE